MTDNDPHDPVRQFPYGKGHVVDVVSNTLDSFKGSVHPTEFAEACSDVADFARRRAEEQRDSNERDGVPE